MGTIAHADKPVRSGARNVCVYPIQFTTNNTSTPDGLVDPAGIVSSLAYSATGNYVVTLAQRFLYVNAHVEHLDATDNYFAKVTAITQGVAAANTVTVSTENVGTGDAATNNKVVRLTLVCWR